MRETGRGGGEGRLVLYQLHGEREMQGGCDEGLVLVVYKSVTVTRFTFWRKRTEGDYVFVFFVPLF